MNPRRVCAGLALLVAALLTACGRVTTLQRKLVDPAAVTTIDRRLPFLKAHLRQGHVVVLSRWEVDTTGGAVVGDGERLDVNRQVVGAGAQRIPLDSVALFETNVVLTHGSVAALGVVTGASLALTAYCLTNTKACFGSCPTFYVSDGRGEVLHAEGFSASVAPALEATDVDALYLAKPRGGTFEVRMTNEALETHVVRFVRLLAAPRPDSGRVFATGRHEFWQARDVAPPTRCRGAEGDCLPALRQVDGVERFTTTDSTDLATREVIELEFESIPPGSAGLVIASRQTLLSTYLLYQALAYMGRSAGAWLAQLERADARARDQASSVARVLGSIEVQAQAPGGEWLTVGETQETGPLATDVRVVPLPRLPAGARHLRLRLTRGHWRIDHVAIARLTKRVEPLRLEPVAVRHGRALDPGALALLTDSARTLVTLPGDEYTLVYALPTDFARRELFLEARGYYLEWMREEWLAEESPMRAARLFLDPAGAMRELAPAFKRLEPEMESTFWRSKYVRP
ncbi:MAG: hypothetical protein M3303_01825 [Gemmatimonadota bacterium]|nr:hypothetical protein [Gemmatimonadota bacterium]